VIVRVVVRSLAVFAARDDGVLHAMRAVESRGTRRQ
jgi:hypothetical protein